MQPVRAYEPSCSEDNETGLTTELPSGTRNVHHPVGSGAISSAKEPGRLQRELGQNLSSAKREANLPTISGHRFFRDLPLEVLTFSLLLNVCGYAALLPYV